MDSNIKDKKDSRGYLDFVFAEAPLIGVLSVVLSNKQSKAYKITALVATIVGLVGAAIYTF